MKTPSTLLSSVMADLRLREEMGLNTYGTTMDREDLSRKQWLQHAYEEALDLALYLKKLINDEHRRLDKLKIKESND